MPPFFPMLAVTTADAVPPTWLLLPFALLLLAIALGPLVHRHWWEKSYHFISLALGAVSAGYYLFIARDFVRLGHATHEYVSFLALVGSLFVVAGGIHIRPEGGVATPAANSLLLFIGALLANVLSTTGASMLLIRPYLRMNKARTTGGFHVVFFIFLVSNVGGCLTPVGDPPLFLGFLKGVPFGWVFAHCWPAWLVAVGALLACFYVLDSLDYRRLMATARGAGAEAPRKPRHWRFDGLRNLAFLGVILAAVFIPERPPGLREAVMAAAAVGSYLTTNPHVHEANAFNFEPIKEVAWLFLGLFATMLPALDYLAAHAPELGINSDAKFYWLTGALSGVLDNAPTYLAFLATALGGAGLSLERPGDLARFLQEHDRTLLAISLGAVFFGAATYIGNAPNFMVKAIAEQEGRAVPGFFEYVWRYTLRFLLPVLLLVAWLFFKG